MRDLRNGSIKKKGITMNWYAVVLFVHIVGVLGYATGTILSLLGLPALSGARRVEQVRSILALLERAGQVSGISLLFTILAGIDMTATAWGWKTGWIDVTLGTLVLLFAFGALMGTRRHAIAALIRDMPDGALPISVEQRIYDPWMRMGIYLLVALLLGIVFLMTVKTGLGGSLLTIGVALILGLGFSLLKASLFKY